MYSAGHRPPVRRAGVTLIELLAAVSIIAVLVSLTFGMFTYAERANKHYDVQVAKASPQHRQASYRVPRHGATPMQIPNQYTVTFKPSVTNPAAEAARIAAAVPA